MRFPATKRGAGSRLFSRTPIRGGVASPYLEEGPSLVNSRPFSMPSVKISFQVGTYIYSNLSTDLLVVVKHPD